VAYVMLDVIRMIRNEGNNFIFKLKNVSSKVIYYGVILLYAA
jgi:hypothetical protein